MIEYNVFDKSGTIAQAATAQTLAATAGRRILGMSNPSAAVDLWFSHIPNVVAAPNTKGSSKLSPGANVEFNREIVTSLSIYAASVIDFTVWEG